MFRARFASPTLGLVASLFILFYMSVMMVAQFKAGALVMKLAWPGSGALSLSEEASAHSLSEGKLDSLDLPDETKRRLLPMLGQNFETEANAAESLKASLPEPEFKAHQKALLGAMKPYDYLYWLGLAIFTLTVVGYTLLGGFLAAVWTDLFQSVMMWVGVMALLFLSLYHAGGLENANRNILQRPETIAADSKLVSPGPQFMFGPGYDNPTVDGYDKDQPRSFMPLGLAVSVFFVWVFSGLASPAGMVRVMASESTAVLRRSIYLLSFYNACIYVPLIIICVCAWSVLPPLGAQSDEVIPRMALTTTSHLPGGSVLAGLILAAPFGAVMATVSSYLVVISSGLVRDVYQRFVNPQATQQEMRRLSYFVMILVGAAAVAANIRPVAFLQAIVVFSGTGAASTFCIPALMLCYWRRATVPGMISSMIAGATTLVSLYVLPQFGLLPRQRIGQFTGFRPYFLLELDPILWGLAASLVVGVAVSLLTRPPEERVVSNLFDADPANR
jgi:SSS family solute:Na+ symporter/sodium/pantothenate symporter